MYIIALEDYWSVDGFVQFADIYNDSYNSNWIMRKSSSAQLFPLDFNPKDFKVGASKIETLPIRRNSTSNIHTLPSQSTRNDLDLLKRQNAALQR